MDSGVVIGEALGRAAAGEGTRRVAAAVDRPESTVRGWVVGARAAAGPVGDLASALVVCLAGDAAPVAPAAVPSASGRYAAAGLALAAALGALWGRRPPGWFAVLAAACGCRPLDAGWVAQREPASVAAALAAGSWAGGAGPARPPPRAPVSGAWGAEPLL
jgi:hypothetical protein